VKPCEFFSNCAFSFLLALFGPKVLLVVGLVPAIIPAVVTVVGTLSRARGVGLVSGAFPPIRADFTSGLAYFLSVLRKFPTPFFQLCCQLSLDFRLYLVESDEISDSTGVIVALKKVGHDEKIIPVVRHLSVVLPKILAIPGAFGSVSCRLCKCHTRVRKHKKKSD
jgi:hypothetical protein